MLSEWIDIGVALALLTLVLMLVPVAYRVAKGPDHPSRLQAIEIFSILLVAVLILLALVQRSSTMVDAGLALAAFSFVATMGIARFITDERMI